MLLARRCAFTLAVEPFAPSAAAVRHNLQLNGLRADVLEAAVGATDGKAFFALRGDDHQHCLTEAREAHSAPVATRSLDSLLAEFGRPDVVKMDLEGAEVAVLEAAHDFLRARPALVVETHSAFSRSTVASLLRESGYSVSAIDTNHLDAHGPRAAAGSMLET
jgi:FkbM family methyltransferase